MPLTEKGQEIKSAMEEQYGPEKGEQVFYASKNAGTISGVDQSHIGPILNPNDSATDAEEEDERVCDVEAPPTTMAMTSPAPAMSSPMPATSPMTSPTTGDQPLVMPADPPLEFEHPQLHPGGSTPPEPAHDKGVYGGIVGGLTDWGKDCFHDDAAMSYDNVSAPPPPTPDPMQSPGVPAITAEQILDQSRRYWEQME